MFAHKYAFSSLPTDADDQQDTEKKRFFEKRAATWKYIFICGSIFLVLSLIAAWALTSRLQKSSSRWSSCGDSVETARQRGCSFDLISFAWQTPECYDAALVSEFASWDSWNFYADDKLTLPVTQEMALHGNRTLFVEWDYHIVHCTFMWRQMHRAYERGWIDSHLGSYNHTLHCQKMILMESAAVENAITVARVIYPECDRVN
ncbi:hypothetical protein EV356DRAFT_237128 [Viridothelium virens]|uniref:Uncharacterized protein n=1 Tax=Viridothelium virens TaxID=1048519 RepID=A0A6A6H4R3_VIRVR|nr:hypothetical protein EV356DRAFT_237128 [Viridothelium virens]